MSGMTVESSAGGPSPSPSPSSPSPAPATPPAGPANAHRRDGGHRDTVESILIAFILAFIFRTFVVEAFVIPTGSMAPTLLGAHARFTCDDCGYRFDTNFSTGGGDDQNIPSAVGHSTYPPDVREFERRERYIACPNCGHVVQDPNDNNTNAPPVPIHYGDRILVLKYAYLLNPPQRWDVVVFKSPDEPTPGTGWYTTNFIKRLVGRPNETLMILDGDVYVSESGGTKPSDFKVQGKPREVRDALWRIVYDNDFVPTALGERAKRNDDREVWVQPWKLVSGGGWDVGTPDKPSRVYTFDSPQGAPTAGTIRFDNSFNRGRAFTDFLAYAEAESGRNNVSDVKLSMLYERKGGDGPLRLRLTKLDNTYTAELSRGSAKLYRKRGTPASDEDLGEVDMSNDSIPALRGGSPVQLDFMNVDYELTLRVAGKDVLHATYPPDVAGLLAVYVQGRSLPKPDVRITAAAQQCAVSHVSLWRDVYYTNGPAGAIRWARPDDPVKLGSDEYFTLGDNTVISKDARYWTEPVKLPAEDLDVGAGRVPGRFLLGKAFFVYWPAGYRPLGSPGLPGLIPNFGDMRFIH
jgi:signal peptidase I